MKALRPRPGPGAWSDPPRRPECRSASRARRVRPSRACRDATRPPRECRRATRTSSVTCFAIPRTDAPDPARNTAPRPRRAPAAAAVKASRSGRSTPAGGASVSNSSCRVAQDRPGPGRAAPKARRAAARKPSRRKAPPPQRPRRRARGPSAGARHRSAVTRAIRSARPAVASTQRPSRLKGNSSGRARSSGDMRRGAPSASGKSRPALSRLGASAPQSSVSTASPAERKTKPCMAPRAEGLGPARPARGRRAIRWLQSARRRRRQSSAPGVGTGRYSARHGTLPTAPARPAMNVVIARSPS